MHTRSLGRLYIMSRYLVLFGLLVMPVGSFSTVAVPQLQLAAAEAADETCAACGHCHARHRATRRVGSSSWLPGWRWLSPAVHAYCDSHREAGQCQRFDHISWWLKLCSYTASDVYCISRGFPISTFVETVVITVEAALLLGLVGFYQRRLDWSFLALGLLFVVSTTWALTDAPIETLAFAQAGSTLLNTAALLPQINLNYQTKSAGDYSPVTAGLACTGCAIRLFTTTRLADGDILLLAGFALGLGLNALLLAQIIYFGLGSGRRLASVLASDFVPEEALRESDEDEEKGVLFNHMKRRLSLCTR